MHHIKQNPGAPNSQHIQYQGKSFTLKSFFCGKNMMKKWTSNIIWEWKANLFLVDTFSFSNRPSKWSNLSRNFVKLSPQEHCKNEISCLKVKGRRKIVKGRNWKSQQRDQIGDHIGEAQSPKCCLFKIWKIMMRPIDQISKLNNNNVIRNTMHCSGNFCQLSHFLRMEPLPLWCQPVWRL